MAEGVFCLLLLVPVLFSDCDVMGGSINDFIDYNTGTARVVSITVTSQNSSAPIIRTRQAWMHDPFINTTQGIISFELMLDNPQHYDLDITPVIYEFIGENGVKVSNPPNRPIKLTWVQGKTDIVSIQIGDTTTPGNKVVQGDSFRIRLDMATKDGKRVFDSYMGIPQIIYDKVLRSPQNILLDTSSGKYSGEGYDSFISWTIDGSEYHVGINRISLTFSSKASVSDIRHWDYVYRGGTTWEMEEIKTTLDEKYRYLLTDDNITFDFPFPFSGDSIADEDGWIEGFGFLIELTDKNGLTTMAGQGVSPETELDNIVISYHYRGTPDSVYINSGWEFVNKEKLIYRIIVPFKVDRVRFNVAKGNDFDDGIQQVLWGSDNFDMPVNSFPLVIGEKSIEMTVHWEDPDILSVDDPKLLTYKFLINRISPSRDSMLKDLFVMDASPLNTVYHPVGGFEDLTPYGSNYDGPVISDYTFYVPSTVSSIKLVGDYLNSSEIYNDYGRADGQATLYPSGSEPLVRDLLDDNDYSEADYYTRPELKIIRNGWTYSLPAPKEYYFRINVKPESDVNETLTRHYFITVIKTDPDGNVNAKLNNITVKAGGTTLLAPGLDSNTFNPNLLNYTVNVPSSANPVTIEAEAIKAALEYKAEIRSVTSVELNPVTGEPIQGTGEQINLSTTSSIGDPPLTISLPAQSKKMVTLKVYSKDGNSTSRDYTITLVRSNSSNITNVTLIGRSGGLQINWTGAADSWAAAREVWYSFYNESDTAKNNPEKAQKALGSFSSGDSVDGLFNNNKYNVWIRSVNAATGQIGDWKKAQTTHSPANLDYGIPGAPELSGFTVTPSSNSLTLLSSGASQNVYSLTVPFSTSSVTVTANIAPNSGVTHNGPFTLSGANLPEGSANAGSTVVFTANSPDGRTSKNYEISVFRLLQAPSSVTRTALDGAVSLVWSGSSVTGVSYDVYYSSSNLSAAQREDSAQKIRGVSGSPITVSSLVNKQSYYFWIRGVKGGIPGEWSADAPAVTPLSTNNSLHTANGITITPSTPLTPAFNPEITEYSVILPATESSITIAGIKGEDNQTLTPPSGAAVNPPKGGKVTHTISVKPDNPIAPNRIYTIIVFRKPDKPVISSLAVQSSTSVYVNWNASDGAEYYEIWYGTSSNSASAAKLGQDIHSSSPRNALITGLTSGTPYYVWVRARSADGILGDYSDAYPAITPIDGHPSIVISFPDVAGDAVFSLTAAGGSLPGNILSWGSNTLLTVNVSGTGASAYRWYVDGILVSGAAAASYAVHARDFSVAKHTVSARITSSNGQVYSKTVEFEVGP